MTSDELRAIIGAMTRGPWSAGKGTWRGEECGIVQRRGADPGRSALTLASLGDNYKADDAAIVALANHAAVLVDIVQACERALELTGWRHDEAMADVQAAIERMRSVPQ